MCDVCGMQYIGLTNNIRLRMNGHKSDYRKFLNGDFSKSDTLSLYSHLKSHDVKTFKLFDWHINTYIYAYIFV